ncbi:MAG: hypothetical protein H5U06_10225 [Candidatus Aminicenantes bacterium]|nr:hypothetical protein [Candidatus Aminicenantes bacterium]
MILAAGSILLIDFQIIYQPATDYLLIASVSAVTFPLAGIQLRPDFVI